MINEVDNFTVLEAVKVRFFSQYDEAAFFEWVQRIPSVKKVEGRGLSVFIFVDSSAVNEEDLRELVSLFWRYNISMTQLSIFDREPFSEWFNDKKAYWYLDIFGE